MCYSARVKHQHWTGQGQPDLYSFAARKKRLERILTDKQRLIYEHCRLKFMGSRKKRPSSIHQRVPDLQDMFRLYMEASRRADVLEQKAHAQRRAGKIRTAKGLEKQARHIRERLAALEQEVRPKPPGSVWK